MLQYSPSLHQLVAPFADQEYEFALEIAIDATGLPSAMFPQQNPYSVTAVLDRGFTP